MFMLALLIALPAGATNGGHGPMGKVVVANRNSGTISVFVLLSRAEYHQSDILIY